MKRALQRPIHNLISTAIPMEVPQDHWQNINYMNAFSANENSIKIVFDPIHLKIVSISEHAASVWGYTSEEILQMNPLVGMNPILLDSLAARLQLRNWFQHALSLAIIHNTHFKTAYCGLRIRHKSGHLLRILVRASMLEMPTNGYPKPIAITVNNISHLVKAPFYWARVAFEKEQQHFISKSKNYISEDIISSREKEVLYWLGQGLSSKEISDRLFISSHTVDHHRRNMLMRTGLRDTTALLQIMHMIGVL